MHLLVILLILILGAVLIYIGFAHARTQNKKMFFVALGSIIVGIASAVLYSQWRDKRKK